MTSAILQILSDCGCTDVEKVRDLARSSSQNLASLSDAILSADLMEDEERFLENVGQHFKMEWLSEPEPDLDQRQALQKACKAGVVVRHRILPIRFDGDPDLPTSKLIVATSDPFDVVTRQMATREFSHPLRWVLAPRKRILEGIQVLYGVGADTFEAILEGRSDFDSNNENKEETTVLDENDAEASVVRFVNDIIRDALNQRSTDIHLEPLSHDLRIRYRIDGVLQEVPVPEQIKTLQASVISRLKVMARLDIAEKRKPQDGRIALQLDGKSIDVRVATIPSVEGESISLRLLGQESFSLERLGLIEAHQKTIEQLLKEPNGIVLVTGPTGSGKSTTLY
ncbi:MAG: ATPase, T2SS/T4P/T4SS family, partial [Verrucomicrobiota bacterium]